MIRALFFLGLFLWALFFPFWSFLGLAVVYAFCYPAVELLLIAVLIDAQFGEVGAGTLWYAYTLSVGIVIIVSTTLKPHLAFYK